MSDTSQTPKRVRWRPRIINKKVNKPLENKEDNVVSNPINKDILPTNTEKNEPEKKVIKSTIVSKRRKSSLNYSEQTSSDDVILPPQNNTTDSKAPFESNKDWPAFNWNGTGIKPTKQYKSSPPGVENNIKPVEENINPAIKVPEKSIDIQPEGYQRPLRRVNRPKPQSNKSENKTTIVKPSNMYGDVLLPLSPPPPAGGSYNAILEWLGSVYPDEDNDFTMYEDTDIQNIATRLWLGELYEEITLPRLQYEEQKKIKNKINEPAF